MLSLVTELILALVSFVAADSRAGMVETTGLLGKGQRAT